MRIDFYVSSLQFVHEKLCCRLVVVSGDYYAVDVQFFRPQLVNHPQYVHVVGYSKIAAYLVPFDISRINADYDFGLVSKLSQKLDFCVRFKSRKAPLCMHVKKKFPTEFQIEFVIVVYALQNEL